jgi:hypothetical protein
MVMRYGRNRDIASGAEFMPKVNMTEHAKDSMQFMDADQKEMLRISQDGFYVRGVRVPADTKEAETVYLAFKKWLAWAALQSK